MSTPAVHAVDNPPLYLPQGNECEVFRSAYHRQLPLLIKGPTGCGKTRFVRHMAEDLGRPLYTVSCHDELSSADLVGRFLILTGTRRAEYTGKKNQYSDQIP